MGHAILNFFITTTGMIAMLYLAYLYIRFKTRHQPDTLPVHGNPQALLLESVLNLEPRKRLYVVRSGSERFLLASTTDQLALLSSLQTLPEAIPVLHATPMGQSAESRLSVAPHGWKDRMQMSLKLVLMDRFAGWKGK